MIREITAVLYIIIFLPYIESKHKIISLCRKLIGRKIVIRTDLCLTRYITYIYIYINWVRSTRKMMGFTQNDWDQRDIINKIKILTKWGTNMIHDVIPTKYQKYPSITILKHVNVLTKVNKSPWGRLHDITPHDAYSIPIHVHTVTLAYSSHEKRSKIPLLNEQYSKWNKAIVQLCQNLHVRFE